VATADSGTSLKKLRADPRTKRLTAVRSGRFGVVRDSLLQPGPQVGTALEQIARILHPDAFR
jgi:ABC-type Fe3+-hydroxamate transport system substrate-binding protein